MLQSNNFIKDVTEQNFQAEVIDASQNHLVVIDFWAEWCGPCQSLKPVLEKLAKEYEGDFTLVKVDVDQSPQLAGMLQIQSIPDVRFIKDGQIVDGFRGSIPEAEIRKKLDAHLPPKQNPEAGFTEMLKAGQYDQALHLLRGKLQSGESEEPVMRGILHALTGQRQFDEVLNFSKSNPSEFGPFFEALATLSDLELTNSAWLPYRERAVQARDEGDWQTCFESLLDLLFRDVEMADGRIRQASVACLELVRDAEVKKKLQRQLSMAIHA